MFSFPESKAFATAIDVAFGFVRTAEQLSVTWRPG
jgi:hypothetical protein